MSRSVFFLRRKQLRGKIVWTTAHVEVFDADQTVDVKNNLYSACHEHRYVRKLSQPWHLKNLPECLAHFKQ